MIRSKLITILILPLFTCTSLFAQNNFDDIYQKAENYYGFSDLLVNGPIYIPKYPKANGSPFFQPEDWYGNTSLFIKGEAFENEFLQYDLVIDQFVLKKSSSKGEIFYVLINNLSIDSVRLNDHTFIRIEELKGKKDDPGFVEIIFRGKESFIFKHSKYFKANYTEDKLFGEYSDQQSDKYLVANGKLLSMNTKREFLNHFKEMKQPIKNFMKKKKIKYKRANSYQMKSLLKFCYEN